MSHYEYNNNVMSKTNEKVMDEQNRPSKLKSTIYWLGSLLVIFFLWWAFFQWGPAKDVAKVIAEQDIDAGAYFYSDTEQCYEAQTFMQNTLDNSSEQSKTQLIVYSIIGFVLFSAIMWGGLRLSE